MDVSGHLPELQFSCYEADKGREQKVNFSVPCGRFLGERTRAVLPFRMSLNSSEYNCFFLYRLTLRRLIQR